MAPGTKALRTDQDGLKTFMSTHLEGASLDDSEKRPTVLLRLDVS